MKSTMLKTEAELGEQRGESGVSVRCGSSGKAALTNDIEERQGNVRDWSMLVSAGRAFQEEKIT